MYLTLKEKMNNVLQNGVDIIREHHELIFASWKEKLSQLQKKQIAEQQLETAIEYYSEWLFSKSGNIEELFKDMQESWRKKLDQFPSNQMVFIITLLENVAHEAIKSKINDSFEKTQAVQYLFSKIHEAIFTESYNKKLDLNIFLEQLVTSRQLPINWAAKLAKSKNGLYVEKMYSQTNHLPQTIDGKMEADTLFAISEALLEIMPSKSGQNQIFPIPWDDNILLFCTNETESQVLPFVMFALQMYRTGEQALKTTKQEQLWKDAVILFDEWIMRSKSLNQAIENITSGFVNYLPFERCALFAYSNTDQSGIGLYGHQLNNEAIKNINENIEGLPLIKKYIQSVQMLGEHMKNVPPIYVSEASEGLPTKYVKQFQLESIVIAPIYVPSESRLIGATILDQGPGKQFKISSEIFTTIMKFGESAGEILAKFGGDRPKFPKGVSTPHLSPREIEVLKLVAEGASTYEAALQLHLSEYTVRDYVSTILKKMNAKNRTEAIVKAMRDGII